MRFRALLTTADGRITEGKLYTGIYSWSHYRATSGTFRRVVVTDDKGQIMSFDPKVFKEQR